MTWTTCRGCRLRCVLSPGSGPATTQPAATLRLSVTLHIDGRTVLAASVNGKRRTYTPRRLLGCALRHPWVTAQVTALIHWQGIRLAARRLPIIPRPAHHAQEGVR